MKRFWLIVMTVLIVPAGISAPHALTVSASGRAYAPLGGRYARLSSRRRTEWAPVTGAHWRKLREAVSRSSRRAVMWRTA
jgi:hypothetical protein